MKKYDVHDYKTGKVHESVSFTEVINITGIPRNAVGRYAREKYIKAGRWCIVYHGEKPAVFVEKQKQESRVSPLVKIRYPQDYVNWFNQAWDNLTIIKLYRKGALQ